MITLSDSLPNDEGDFPVEALKVNVIIGRDGQGASVFAKTDGGHRWREWDDMNLAVHTGEVHRSLLDLGFVSRGPWKPSPDRSGMLERCCTR